MGESYVEALRAKVGHAPLILVGANVIVVDGDSKILLQRRSSGHWGLPGGQMEYGESLEQTACREVLEETGLIVDVSSLRQLHTFSGGEYEFILDNEDRLSAVTTLFCATKYEGTLCKDGLETLGLGFFDPHCLPFDMEREYVTYVEYYLDGLAEPDGGDA